MRASRQIGAGKWGGVSAPGRTYSFLSALMASTLFCASKNDLPPDMLTMELRLVRGGLTGLPFPEVPFPSPLSILTESGGMLLGSGPTNATWVAPKAWSRLPSAWSNPRCLGRS